MPPVVATKDVFRSLRVYTAGFVSVGQKECHLDSGSTFLTRILSFVVAMEVVGAIYRIETKKSTKEFKYKKNKRTENVEAEVLILKTIWLRTLP